MSDQPPSPTKSAVEEVQFSPLESFPSSDPSVAPSDPLDSSEASKQPINTNTTEPPSDSDSSSASISDSSSSFPPSSSMISSVSDSFDILFSSSAPPAPMEEPTQPISDSSAFSFLSEFADPITNSDQEILSESRETLEEQGKEIEGNEELKEQVESEQRQSQSIEESSHEPPSEAIQTQENEEEEFGSFSGIEKTSSTALSDFHHLIQTQEILCSESENQIQETNELKQENQSQNNENLSEFPGSLESSEEETHQETEAPAAIQEEQSQIPSSTVKAPSTVENKQTSLSSPPPALRSSAPSAFHSPSSSRPPHLPVHSPQHSPIARPTKPQLIPSEDSSVWSFFLGKSKPTVNLNDFLPDPNIEIPPPEIFLASMEKQLGKKSLAAAAANSGESDKKDTTEWSPMDGFYPMPKSMRMGSIDGLGEFIPEVRYFNDPAPVKTAKQAIKTIKAKEQAKESILQSLGSLVKEERKRKPSIQNAQEATFEKQIQTLLAQLNSANAAI
jgi:hypothetical protein